MRYSRNNYSNIVSICIVLGCVVMSLCVLSNCTKDKPRVQKLPDEEIPVSLSCKPEAVNIVSDNIIDISYEWKLTAPEPRIQQDYKVLVHFVDENGSTIFLDDHHLPVPISKWKSGEPVTYTRPVYIPFSVEKKQVSLVVGLYDEKNTRKKIGLANMPPGLKPGRYVLATLTVEASEDFTLDSERMEFEDGWYQIERDVQNRLQWWWTKKEAVCRLLNPKKTAVLFLHCWVHEFDPPATISIELNSRVLETFTSRGEFIRKYDIDTDLLGQDEWATLVLRTDKTYDPADYGNTDDSRTLGIMVKRIFFK